MIKIKNINRKKNKSKKNSFNINLPFIKNENKKDLDIIFKNKIYFSGLLSIVLIIFLGLKADNFKAYFTSPPKIACPDEMLGCDRAADSDITRHWLFDTGIPNWIEWMILFAAGSSVVAIIIGGIMFLVSIGNEELQGKGKKTIILASVGLLIAMLSFAIVKIIENISFPGVS